MPWSQHPEFDPLAVARVVSPGVAPAWRSRANCDLCVAAGTEVQLHSAKTSRCNPCAALRRAVRTKLSARFGIRLG